MYRVISRTIGFIRKLQIKWNNGLNDCTIASKQIDLLIVLWLVYRLKIKVNAITT
jgi:hypothetical protein